MWSEQDGESMGKCNHVFVCLSIQFLLLFFSGTFQTLYVYIVHVNWNVKCWSAASVESGIWASLKRYLLSSLFVQKHSNNSPPLEHVTSTASRPQLFQELSSPISLSFFWPQRKRRAITGASAAAERQRGMKRSKRFLLLLLLRERPWRLDRLRGEKMLEGRGKKRGTDYVMWGLVYMFPLSSC